MPANVFWYLSTRLHGITSPNTVFIMVIVVWTSTCFLQFCIVLLAEADDLNIKEENTPHFATRTSASFATLNLLLSAEIKWLLCFGTVVENPLLNFHRCGHGCETVYTGHRLAVEGHMNCNNEACCGLKFLSFKTLKNVCVCVCEVRKGRKRINKFPIIVSSSSANFHPNRLF